MPENLSIHLYLDDDENDLPLMSVLEGDGEVELEQVESVPERVKSNHQKKEKEGTGLNILTPNKLITRPQISLTQTKARVYKN